MKTNLEKTTVKQIAHLINSACLRADRRTTLDELAGMLCASTDYKVYLEDEDRRLVGVVQARRIAMKILALSPRKEDEDALLPAIAHVLNFHCGADVAEPPLTVQGAATLREVLELMEGNQVRVVAVVDEGGRLLGTLEAKNILAYYLRAKAEASL